MGEQEEEKVERKKESMWEWEKNQDHNRVWEIGCESCWGGRERGIEEAQAEQPGVWAILRQECPQSKEDEMGQKPQAQ